MNIFAFVTPFQHAAQLWAGVFLYIGPDVFLPVTSALAALAGFLLMFWHRVVGFVGRIFGRGARRTAEPPKSDAGRD